jgi:hypothetical protein
LLVGISPFTPAYHFKQTIQTASASALMLKGFKGLRSFWRENGHLSARYCGSNPTALCYFLLDIDVRHPGPVTYGDVPISTPIVQQNVFIVMILNITILLTGDRIYPFWEGRVFAVVG